MVHSTRGRGSQSGLKNNKKTKRFKKNQGGSGKLGKITTSLHLKFLICRLGDNYSANHMKWLSGSNESLLMKCLGQ